MALVEHHHQFWPTSLRQGSSKAANSHCFTPAENQVLHINRKKKKNLGCPNQSCPACWSCQQWRKFMLVLIMALKSSLMKNYLWVCLSEHASPVVHELPAPISILSQMSFLRTQSIWDWKQGPCKLKFIRNIFFGRVHRSAYKERKYLCFLLQSYQILKRERSPLVRSR